MSKASKSEQAEAIARLREWIKPSDTVYTILRSVSRSGMSRVISLIVFSKEDNRPLHISWNAAKAMEWGHDDKKEGLKVSGCGMDMGFHAVYTLSRVLFRDQETTEKDAGYLLNHRWL